MMIRAALLAAALIAFDFGLAHGADISAGGNLARTLCVNCHVVDPGAATQQKMTVGIPSFQAIAEKRGQTEDNLKLFILKPHAPMPEMQLTTHELDNLAGYIMSLKGPR